VKSLEEVQARARELLRPSNHGGWWESLGLASSAAARWTPRAVKNGACQQVVRLASDVDLEKLLCTRWWPDDEAPSLPAALVFAQAPDDAWRSIELCSLVLLDKQRLLLEWEPHRGLARLWQQYARRGERLPVAVALGAHPVDTLSAAAPLTAQADRWTLAGFLRDRPCEMVRCRTLPLDVPADAEIIVEGYLDPAAPRAAAPRRAELTGFYSLPSEAVVMQATAVTHRANPVQVAVQPTRPPHELAVIRQAMLEALKPMALALAPEVVDFHFPAAAGCRQAAIVSISKTRPHQARQAAGALWACEPWIFARLLVIVDEDAPVNDPGAVLLRVLAHADLARDVFHQPAPANPGTTVLMGIDATRKLPGEGARSCSAEASASASIEEFVARRWAEYGIRST
jgi:4-hydroxy-3-polyprenylbenzoate decarboxylase